MKKLIDKVLRFLVKVRCISFYSDSDTGSYTYSKGVISSVTYVSGYFQNPSLLRNEVFSSLLPKKEHVDKARAILKKTNKNKSVFVHIRRGDFVSTKGESGFLAYGKSVLLPLNYYKKAILKISITKEKVTFVFMSDDPNYVEENFSELQNTIITSESMEIDFVVASLCDGGILSASTFSFWASMIAMHVNGATLPFYAPTYWLGHASETWYPQSMKSVHLSYVYV